MTRALLLLLSLVPGMAVCLTPGAGRMLSPPVPPDHSRGIPPGSVVVGATDPDETVTITGTDRIDSDVFVVNNGKLLVEEAELSLAGEVTLLGNGVFRATSSTLVVEQAYSYEHGFVVFESGSFVLDDVEIRSQGSTGVSVAQNGVVDFDDVSVSEGFLTWAIFQDATVDVRGSAIAGEFLSFGQSDVHIADSDFVLLWLTLEEGATMDTTLPDGEQVEAFALTPDSPFATGVTASTSVTSCTRVLWGVMAESGASATFRDSDMRIAGAIFNRENEVTVEGIANGAFLSDSEFNWGDVTYRFINTRVGTWNFYAWADTQLTIQSSLFGEAIAEGTASATVIGSLCDGTGGYIGAAGTARMFLVASTNLSQLAAQESALVVCSGCALSGGPVVSDDTSVIAFDKTLMAWRPERLGDSVMYLLDIERFEAPVDSLVSIRGSATALLSGTAPIAFQDYQLEYATSSAPDDWTTIAIIDDRTVRDGVLAVWDTTGFEPGAYSLRLTYRDTLVNELPIGQAVVLTPNRGESRVNAWGVR